MRNYFLIFAVFCVLFTAKAQELNALVTINTNQVQSTNKQVYQTLQKSLSEFINQTKWTNKKVAPQERINCAFTIIVGQQSGNVFTSSIQVQATRPVYGSSYETPIINTNDSDFRFQYNEFDPLIFNINNYNGNLISTIVFYVYTILGVDADTFKLKGGQEYFKTAASIASLAQQNGAAGWENKIGEANRFMLIENMLSSKFTPLRQAYYNYHRKGFDMFSKNEKSSKTQIANSIISLEKIFNVTVGNNMIRFFLDAKSDEIVSVFSDGRITGREERLKSILKRIAPTFGSKWKNIQD